MTALILLIAALTAFGVSAWLTSRFSHPSSRFHILDTPNERSLHVSPTPRSGGIAILVGLLAGGSLVWILAGAVPDSWMLAALVPVVIVSVVDDRASMPVLIRLLTHVAGAVLLVWGGDFTLQNNLLPGIEVSWLPWIGTLFLLGYVVWMINLYNFMDGMDGFAAGMGVIGFGFLGLIAWQAGHIFYAQSSFVVVGAVGGFLIFNFPPARIFMGDVGSSTLGFLAAAFSLWGAHDGVFHLWVAVLIFSPFIVDASVTLVRRLLSGEVVWKAHKSHYYQKLVQAGWGHRKTVLMEYAIMVGCGITALLIPYAAFTVVVLMLTGWILFYIIFFFWISKYAARRHIDSF